MVGVVVGGWWSWTPANQRCDGGPCEVDLFDDLCAFTLGVICEAGFGLQLNGDTSDPVVAQASATACNAPPLLSLDHPPNPSLEALLCTAVPLMP